MTVRAVPVQARLQAEFQLEDVPSAAVGSGPGPGPCILDFCEF